MNNKLSPQEKNVERALKTFRPKPSSHFYRKMDNAPWMTGASSKAPIILSSFWKQLVSDIMPGRNYLSWVQPLLSYGSVAAGIVMLIVIFMNLEKVSNLSTAGRPNTELSTIETIILAPSIEELTRVTSPISSELEVGGFTSLTFTSKTAETPETGRQEINIRVMEPGDYSFILSNENSPHSNHWIIWDHISLRYNDEIIWSIGEDESPPDYSDKASSELCVPQKEFCISAFLVGTSEERMYSREINDGEHPLQKISFALPEQYVNADLTLVLSTLYATHKDDYDVQVDNFKMGISLIQNN